MKRSRLAALAALSLVLGLALLMRRSSGQLGHDPAAGAREAGVATRKNSVAPPLLPPAFARRADREPMNARYVRDVTIEPRDVCVGDLATVKVSLATAPADSRDMRVLIDGKPGEVAAITATEPGARTFVVHAWRDGEASGDVDSLAFEITAHPCAPRPRLRLDSPVVTSEGRHRFVARLEEGHAAAGYRWSFGDGTTADTQHPIAEHDFSDRPQDSLSSTFLVTVRAIVAGVPVEASAAVTLENTYYINRRNGVVAPLVVASPTERGDRELRVALSIRQFEIAPIKLDRADVVFTDCADNSIGGATATPEAILGRADVPPGLTKASLRLLRSALPEGTCFVAVSFHGQVSGAPAAFFAHAVAQEPKAGSIELTSLTDPESRAEVQKVSRALQRLGRTGPEARISMEEIARLEAEGAL